MLASTLAFLVHFYSHSTVAILLKGTISILLYVRPAIHTITVGLLYMQFGTPAIDDDGSAIVQIFYADFAFSYDPRLSLCVDRVEVLAFTSCVNVR